ncbi:MAG TPA: autotransporter-associated beta strand repeat-containing protein [Pirellulales bacterium]|nr:autotransporter-associated beta strand repeat-containing protein [Pirellulales bacterium]
MNLRRIFLFLLLAAALCGAPTAFGHGVTVNVDLSADGTKLITDRPVYADRDITAITNIDQSLGYDQDDDVPGFEFSSNVTGIGGVISLKIVGPTHLWNPTSQLQATTTSSVLLDSLFYFAPASGGQGPVGESVVGQTAISSTVPVTLYDPASPPATDHHYAAYNLTAGAGGSDPSVGAYGLWVELIDTTASGTIRSDPFIIGVNNGLTHAISSFGAGGIGDHQQPSNDGTQYGAAVAAFQAQVANNATWNFNGGGNYSAAVNWAGNPLQGIANAGTTVMFSNGSTTPISLPTAVITIDGAYTAGALIFDNIGGTNYTLSGDGVAGHGITLNNNGAGASINVLGGSHMISAPLTLAEPTVVNVEIGAILTLTGPIGESSPGTPLYMTGGGALIIGSSSQYTGATTVSGGTLRTNARGTISAGPLALDTSNYVASSLQLGGSQTVASLHVSGDGTGTATIVVAAGQKLTVQQPITQDAATTLQVTGDGRLQFSAAAGNATVGAGASVLISPQSTLELAGTVSDISTDLNLVNNGARANGGGLIVSGSNQEFGNLDGSGDLFIGAGADLTANHVIQESLSIGGTASSPGLMTIAASDAGMTMTSLGSAAAVPEPNSRSMALVAAAVAAISARRQRRRKKVERNEFRSTSVSSGPPTMPDPQRLDLFERYLAPSAIRLADPRE